MDTRKKLLMIGGGGHCKSVLDCVLESSIYSDVAIVDYDSSLNTMGVRVIGDDNDLFDLHKNGWTDAFISVGSVEPAILRQKLYRMVKEIGFYVPSIVDDTAVIAKEVKMAEGVFVGKKSVINAGTNAGVCSIFNTGCIVEHDCYIGDFAHVSPGAVLCGNVKIGNNSHIGAGSVIRQGITVGEKSMVGAGSVVVKDVKDSVKAYGNPCKEVE